MRCTKFRSIVIYMDIWPWQNETKSPSSNSTTFYAMLAILRTALAAPSLRKVDLVIYVRHHVLSVPSSLATPENMSSRLGELDWERLNDIVPAAPATGLDTLRVRVDRTMEGTGEPWMVDQLKKMLDARLTSRVRDLVRYS